MGSWYLLTLGVLATWRVTHLFHAEEGPWQMLARFRQVVSTITILRRLFDCFYCLSLWVAVPFALLLEDTWTNQLLLVPALSAAAIFVEHAMQPPMPRYIEGKVPDELLWKEDNTKP